MSHLSSSSCLHHRGRLSLPLSLSRNDKLPSLSFPFKGPWLLSHSDPSQCYWQSQVSQSIQFHNLDTTHESVFLTSLISHLAIHFSLKHICSPFPNFPAKKPQKRHSAIPPYWPFSQVPHSCWTTDCPPGPGGDYHYHEPRRPPESSQPLSARGNFFPCCPSSPLAPCGPSMSNLKGANQVILRTGQADLHWNRSQMNQEFYWIERPVLPKEILIMFLNHCFSSDTSWCKSSSRCLP